MILTAIKWLSDRGCDDDQAVAITLSVIIFALFACDLGFDYFVRMVTR